MNDYVSVLMTKLSDVKKCSDKQCVKSEKFKELLAADQKTRLVQSMAYLQTLKSLKSNSEVKKLTEIHARKMKGLTEALRKNKEYIDNTNCQIVKCKKEMIALLMEVKRVIMVALEKKKKNGSDVKDIVKFIKDIDLMKKTGKIDFDKLKNFPKF